MEVLKYLNKDGLKLLYEFLMNRFSLIKTIDGITPDSEGRISAALRTQTINRMFPVGSVLLTLKPGNPSVYLGGQWVKVDQNASGAQTNPGGYMLLTANNVTNGFMSPTNATASYTYSSFVKGANTMQLVSENLPKHTHSLSMTLEEAGSHSHDRGTMDITGRHLQGNWGTANPCRGAFYQTGAQGGPCTHKGYGRRAAYFSADRTWSGESGSGGGHTHTVTESTVAAYGKGEAFSYLPKCIPVWVWVRIG